jgi:hypothetical protein
MFGIFAAARSASWPVGDFVRWARRDIRESLFQKRAGLT